MKDRGVFGENCLKSCKTHGLYFFSNPPAFVQGEFRILLGLCTPRQDCARQTFLSRGTGCRPSLHLFPAYIKDNSTASTDKQCSSALMNSKWFSCIRVWDLVNFSLTYIWMFISILTSTLIMSSLICPEPCSAEITVELTSNLKKEMITCLITTKACRWLTSVDSIIVSTLPNRQKRQ